MKEQFGTVAVREARLTRDEVGQMVAEVLKLRGPNSYDFDYARPILIWSQDGGLTVRWPQTSLREDPGREPSFLKLMSWTQFVQQEAAEQAKREAKAKPPAAVSPPEPPQEKTDA